MKSKPALFAILGSVCLAIHGNTMGSPQQPHWVATQAQVALEPIVLSGTVIAQAFEVQSDSRLLVVDDTEIVASGPLTIHGRIDVSPQQDPTKDRAPRLVLRSLTAIFIDGVVEGGAGLSRTESDLALDGGRGSDLFLDAPVVLVGNTIVRAGHGGRGGPSGRGGAGGDIEIRGDYYRSPTAISSLSQVVGGDGGAGGAGANDSSKPWLINGGAGGNGGSIIIEKRSAKSVGRQSPSDVSGGTIETGSGSNNTGTNGPPGSNGSNPGDPGGAGNGGGTGQGGQGRPGSTGSAGTSTAAPGTGGPGAPGGNGTGGSGGTGGKGADNCPTGVGGTGGQGGQGGAGIGGQGGTGGTGGPAFEDPPNTGQGGTGGQGGPGGVGTGGLAGRGGNGGAGQTPGQGGAPGGQGIGTAGSGGEGGPGGSGNPQGSSGPAGNMGTFANGGTNSRGDNGGPCQNPQ